MNNKLTIGIELTAKIVAQLNNKEWEVSLLPSIDGWSGKLVSKYSILYKSEDVDIFWIYGIDNSCKTILLSDSDFGKLPISDRMRPRYIQSLKYVIDIISNYKVDQTLISEHFSEVKGMINRCIRKDQWDWLSVNNSFQNTDINELKTVSDCFKNIIQSTKHKDNNLIKEYFGIIVNLKFDSKLKHSLNWILNNVPKLKNATSFIVHNSQKEIENNNREHDPYIISQIARAKLEKANSEHSKTLKYLVSYLESYGYIVERSQLIDAFCRLKTGPAIFEVKSINESNERAQCRHALSQLYEYRYLHDVKNASLWLVLSSPPTLQWLLDYLKHDRGINMVWFNNDLIEGPDINLICQSGSSAINNE